MGGIEHQHMVMDAAEPAARSDTAKSSLLPQLPDSLHFYFYRGGSKVEPVIGAAACDRIAVRESTIGEGVKMPTIPYYMRRSRRRGSRTVS